jgi:hypothetical protein
MTSLFERCLADLRDQGGAALFAAKRVEERKFVEAYEAALMSRVNDAVLPKIFPGLCKNKVPIEK